MAGAGYKLFNTGDVLTAAQVNTYLMEQTVMVFADAAARTTALTGVVSEGMISYLKDTNAVEVYNGSAWVASDDPNAIQNTIVDAKGDLIAASAADTPARLAVGNNGESLVADSSTSTGLRYNPLPISQPVINGGSDIWQRGTSIAIPSSAWTYANDRFYYYRGATGLTISRQATNDSTNLPFIEYCTRVQRDSGNTSTVSIYQYHDIETANSIPYAGRTITISFYARKGANWSVSGDTLPFQVITGTGTDQNLRGGYTGAATLINTSFTLTTTWQRFSATATVSATATQIGFQLPNITPSGTAGAADFYEITGIQIDFGSVALPFRRAGGTLAGELAACQRYYYRATSGSAYGQLGGNSAYTVSTVSPAIPFPVVMRTAPTAVDTSGTGSFILENNSSTSASSFTSIAINTSVTTPQMGVIDIVKTSAFTTGIYYKLIANNSTTAYVGFSAEL